MHIDNEIPRKLHFQSNCQSAKWYFNTNHTIFITQNSSCQFIKLWMDKQLHYLKIWFRSDKSIWSEWEKEKNVYIFLFAGKNAENKRDSNRGNSSSHCTHKETKTIQNVLHAAYEISIISYLYYLETVWKVEIYICTN